MTQKVKATVLEDIFAGGSEMGNLMLSLDWSQTLLGSVSQWAQSLKTAVSIILTSRYPMFIWWGSKYANLYNDAYRPILGASKHPQFLGQSAQNCWADVWDVVGPLAESVITTGQPTWCKDFLLLMDRNGYLEETYFTFSYSPVQDESGGIGGIFCAVIETTERIIGERRLRSLRELASNTAEAKTVQEACHAAIEALTTNPHDIPFALLYRVETEGKQAHLVGTAGIDRGTNASPDWVDLSQAESWNFPTEQAELISDLTTRFGEFPGGVWSESPTQALIIPLAQSGQKQHLAGWLIVGINPRRAFDDDYRGFLELIGSNVATAIANAEAYETQKKRAEELAELDRAKTVFFNLENVLSSISDLFFALDNEWRYTYVNDRLTEVVKLSKEELLGKSIWEVFPDALGSQFDRELHRAMSEQTPVHFEYFYAPLNRWFENRVYPSADGLSIFAADITERKQAEYRLQEQAQELTQLNATLTETTALVVQRNQELDRFTYVVSHDLKAPLRAIANLSIWLEEDLDEQLPEANQHQLMLLRQRVNRLEAMIDGLLLYSRVGRTKIEEKTVNVGQLLTEIFDSLAPIPTFTLEIQSPMPTLVTKKLLLSQVFSNLISNAIKHHDRTDGRIEISARDKGKYYKFAVTDDGPGIALKHHQKIFDIFQTLKAHDKQENTGIGLTIVKKIVETEGGEINLHSELGKGATFSFTWIKST